VPDSDSSSRPLAGLFVTLLLNVSLMCVGILWFTGQFTTLMSWAALGDSELTINVDREGWLFQCAAGRWVSSMNGSMLGVRTIQRDTNDTSSTTWNVALADSQPAHPVPGVLLASGTQFRIVAVRHWLMFTFVLLMWLIWQLGIPAMRRLKSAAPLPPQD
jgi:hypothetical protein